MLAKVVIENGQKKIQALTADTGVGAPVGSYLYLEKKSNPQGYLYCDGSTFDETAYPALYQYLGTNVLPDWRELGAKGAEKNTTLIFDSTETDPSTGQAGTQNHDVFTQGEFKDDALQKITGTITVNANATDGSYITGASGALGTDEPYTATSDFNNAWSNPSFGKITLDSSRVTRNDPNANVTRGKSRAVFIYIKATSGLTENQQENVLNTINENNSYSTEEHPTGKKWIDGKPIYSKVLVVPTTIIADGNSYKSLGVGYPDNADTMFPPIVFNNATNTLYYNTYKPIKVATLISGGITIPAGTEIIIEYTKTTD